MDGVIVFDGGKQLVLCLVVIAEKVSVLSYPRIVVNCLEKKSKHSDN